MTRTKITLLLITDIIAAAVFIAAAIGATLGAASIATAITQFFA